MGTVYAVANQKGGVGKTTTAVNVASCVAAAGSQTLLVDLDPQCNATVALGGGREMHPSSYDCLTGDVSVAEAARPAGPDNSSPPAVISPAPRSSCRGSMGPRRACGSAWDRSASASR
jgi:chromosome partitioning protein